MHETRLGLNEADLARGCGEAGEVVGVDVDSTVGVEEGFGANIERGDYRRQCVSHSILVCMKVHILTCGALGRRRICAGTGVEARVEVVVERRVRRAGRGVRHINVHVCLVVGERHELELLRLNEG